MQLIRKNGATSNLFTVTLLNSSTGNRLTGLTSASSGLIVSTRADNEPTATAYSGSNLESITTLGTFAAPTSGKLRFKEIDATNHPGDYEVQAADARFAVSGAKELRFTFSGAANLMVKDVEFQLTAVDLDDSVRFGLSILNGITSLAQWLGLIAGKQTGNSTARTELRATGGGSGTFDETTDALEALRDRGDAAWLSGSTLTAADIRAAMGLAAANLDTRLDDLADENAVDTAINTAVAPLATQVSLDAIGIVVTAISTAVTGIVATLGLWTGTGYNTILGAFRALFRKDADAPVPSDINFDLGAGAGQADNTTDSLEALHDAIMTAISSSGVVLTAAERNKIADHVRRRTQANVEASADGDALSWHSLYGFIQQAQKSNIVGTNLVIQKTDATTLATIPVASSGSANPLTGID